MSASPHKRLTGICSHCQGPVEYPAELIGTAAPCPHCGQTTELLLAMPEAEPAIPRKAIVWILVGLFILVLGLGVPMWGLHWAKHHKERIGAKPAPGLEVSALAVEQSADGRPVQVTGVLGNNSEHQRAGIRVVFELLDSAGEKVGLGTYYRPLLKPREQAEFKVSAQAPKAVSARVVSIQEGWPAQP